MVMLKACPRCKGDMTVGSDGYGRYCQCLQCGHTRELDSAPQIKPVTKIQLAPAKKVKARTG